MTAVIFQHLANTKFFKTADRRFFHADNYTRVRKDLEGGCMELKFRLYSVDI